VALAASSIGLAAVRGVLVAFSAATLGTFVVLTVRATLLGYRSKVLGWKLIKHVSRPGVLAVTRLAVFAGL
jgi:hypothetical protein